MSFHNANETLDEVVPEPMPEYTEAPENGGEPVDLDDVDDDPASVPANPTHLDRMPSMTDVLNSPPNIPVSPKIERTPTSPSAIPPVTLSPTKVETAAEQTPPPPPRPLSPFSQSEKTLKEMFPNIDAAVVKAVLIASGGQLDPAFNALLSMSDPAFVPELPPRPEQRPAKPAKSSQLEADEAYARRLAAELNADAPQPKPRPLRRGYQETASAVHEKRAAERRSRAGAAGYDGSASYYPEDKDWSFFDDDLPVIKENLTQTFNETKTKINGWVANLRKKLDGEDDSPTDYYSSSSGSGRVYSKTGRPVSYDYQIGRQASYDNDPTVLDDNFSHLNLVDNANAPPKPPRPSGNRPLANKELYTTKAPRSKDIVDDAEELYTAPAPLPARSTDSTSSPSRGKWEPLKNGKWEPLKAVEPQPDKDPFFIGDSDDEGAATPAEETKKQVRFAAEDDLK